ncbi:MAG: acetyl-CoA acetyltransferase [Gammaproteobacteria bacterium]|nr:acetyl-CoA acetyltransferase [Gammaproteobacteria bacterium]
MKNKLMPVIVGVGQVSQKEFGIDSSSAVALMEEAVLNSAENAGLSREALGEADTLAVVKSFRESTRNSPEALAKRIDANKAKQWLMPNGGNGPQYLVNRFNEAIAEGKCEFVVLAGSEAMATARMIVKTTGNQPQWEEPSFREPEYLINDAEMSSEHERQHGLWLAPGFYAMAENAYRHWLGVSIQEHQIQMGRLFSRFTEVAEKNEHAWYPIKKTPEEIAYPSKDNRLVAWPYTKYMSAMNQINQGAAIILMSKDRARRFGIGEEKFVYLHGAADTAEKPISTRPNFYSSHAMEVLADQVFEGSGLSMDEISWIDFYSCFPSAVEFARDAFGLSKDDPRDLTVTGGLPFHGGAGNNYVMNSIATMVETVRANRESFGLVTANGGYLSKHSAGIYSTTPLSGSWSRRDPSEYQSSIDRIPDVKFLELPSAEAVIETYTVLYGRDNRPSQALVVGRLGTSLENSSSPRFLSVMEGDTNLLEAMTKEDMIGRKGSVERQDRLNKFSLS